MARSWSPSLLIQASAALHGAAALGSALQPASWPWAVGVIALNHAALTASGLWPRSQVLGPNWLKLTPSAAQRGEVAITLDDGPDPQLTPAVLDVLDEGGARASFFCIGARAKVQPELCREIIRRGHSIENHTQTHPWTFSMHGYRRLKNEIGDAQKTLADITGQAPQFFRAVAGLRSPLLEPVLADLDLQLASWTRRGFDSRNSDPKIVHRRLVSGLAAGDILLMHDGHCARDGKGQAVILRALPMVLASLASQSLAAVTLRRGCQ